MLRIDLENRTVLASVGALVRGPADVPRPGGVLGFVRTVLGQTVHREWRARRERDDPAFRAEVGVAFAHEVDGFRVEIRGRADGVIERGDSLVVEEVKSVESTGVELRGLSLRDQADAALQVRLYALALARAEPGRRVGARLVLVSTLDGSLRELIVPFDADRVARRLDRILRARIEAARAEADRRRDKAACSRALVFPHGSRRPGQADLEREIAAGLASGRPVLATAPTGIGKTVSALLPTLRFALERGALLFFLTARNTQQALAAETFVALVAAAGRPADGVRALTFREKRGMCPPETLLCHPDHCAWLKGFLDTRAREAAIADLLDGEAHIGPERVLAVGCARTLCPYGLALALTTRVDVVIGDLNYVYDPAVSLDLFGEDGTTPREVVVVVDEAHNLFDRAREYWSPFLSRSAVGEQAEAARRRVAEGPAPDEREPHLPGLAPPGADPGLDADLAAWLEDLAAAMDGAGREAATAHPMGVGGCRLAAPTPAAWAARGREAGRLLLRHAVRRRALGDFRLDDPLVTLLHETTRLADGIAAAEPELYPFAADASAATGEGVGVSCVDPARRLRERHERVAGTVAMSATLTPLEYFARVLGFADLDPLRVALPSPFPAENRCVLVDPSVATTFRERHRHEESIARRIETVIRARPGNYLACFPSFRFLEAVRARLRAVGTRVLVQRPRMAPAERARFLEALRAGEGPCLLLAVMGGVFAEGIDLEGEALVGAIVVGPGLPSVGFERALMQHHFQNAGADGFAYAMLHPGMQRVIQAAGRVHRSPDDRGIVVLLGRRFTRPPYAACLPAHWYRYDPHEMVAHDLGARLEAFWRDVEGRRGNRAPPTASNPVSA